MAGGYVAFFGFYCPLNFWACPEAHCAVTGPGFGVVGLLGLVAAGWPGGALSWYRVGPEGVAFLAVLAAGFAFERAVVSRGGQRQSY
ncbi:MAG: hypothetical protein ACREN1_09125 [Candidatus Dormibacteria bacterium]